MQPYTYAKGFLNRLSINFNAESQTTYYIAANDSYYQHTTRKYYVYLLTVDLMSSLEFERSVEAIDIKFMRGIIL